MECHLNSLGFGVWKSIKDGYVAPASPPIDPTRIRLYENNAKAKNAILCGLDDSKFLKVMGCGFAKDFWKNLSIIYEGDTKVKKANMYIFKRKFETLRI